MSWKVLYIETNVVEGNIAVVEGPYTILLSYEVITRSCKILFIFDCHCHCVLREAINKKSVFLLDIVQKWP